MTKQTVLYGGDYKEDVKQQPGSAAVVQSVANDKFAIGYSGHQSPAGHYTSSSSVSGSLVSVS